MEGLFENPMDVGYGQQGYSLRKVLEGLGGEVSWKKTGKITLVHGDKKGTFKTKTKSYHWMKKKIYFKKESLNLKKLL